MEKKTNYDIWLEFNKNSGVFFDGIGGFLTFEERTSWAVKFLMFLFKEKDFKNYPKAQDAFFEKYRDEIEPVRF